MGRIVVGIDGSDESLGALRWAQRFAAPDDTVHAVHVWASPVSGGVEMAHGGGTRMASRTEVLEAEARQLLDGALAVVDPGGVARTDELVMASSRTAGLMRAAQGADMLVAGLRPHSIVDRMIIGSVPIQCAQHAPCPFVGVPTGAPRSVDPVAVALDGSESSRAALLWAAATTDRRDVRLRVVTVWEEVGWSSGPQPAEPPRSPDERALDEIRAGVRAIAPDVVDRAEYRPVHASDDVAAHILEGAEGAGLLVMGSRGRGGFAGLLLGSVSQKCLENSTIPVAIVRE